MAGLTKQVIRRVPALLAAALVVACWLMLYPHERLLMREAKKVTTVSIGALAQNRMRYLPCIWRSDHAVIVMTNHADGKHYEFVEVDTDTGVQRPLTVVNNRCRDDLQIAYTDPLSGRIQPPGVQVYPRVQADPPFYGLSSDGQRLIFARWNYPVPFTYSTIALDGTEKQRWRSSEHWTRSLWLRDSLRWLEPIYKFDQVQTLILHDIRLPEQNIRIPIPGEVGGGFVLGVTQDERLLGVVRNSGKPVASVQMINCDFLSPVPVPQKYLVQFPRLATLRGVQLSTKHDRLAWVLLYDNTARPLQWLHRLVPKIPLRPRKAVGLWVSRVDGSQMTEIGHTAVSLDGEPKLGYSLQWLPGDQKLSFLYRDALYTVPSAVIHNGKKPAGRLLLS